jgi:hypothetical protein
MLPPIGFISLDAYGPADASGFATTWLVTTTATPNYDIQSDVITDLTIIGHTSSASRWSVLRNLARCV